MISMKRRNYGRDAGLTLRMLFTTGLLGLLYVVFAVVLINFLNVGWLPMLVIIGGLAFVQYYTSDKLALAAAGAKVVERDEAPDLHDVSITAMRGFGRSAIAHSRSTTSWRSGASSRSTTLAPAAASASLSEV